MYTYIFMTSVRVIPVSAVLSRVPYGYDFLHMARNRGLHTPVGQKNRIPGPDGRQTIRAVMLDSDLGSISQWDFGVPKPAADCTSIFCKV